MYIFSLDLTFRCFEVNVLSRAAKYDIVYCFYAFFPEPFSTPFASQRHDLMCMIVPDPSKGWACCRRPLLEIYCFTIVWVFKCLHEVYVCPPHLVLPLIQFVPFCSPLFLFSIQGYCHACYNIKSKYICNIFSVLPAMHCRKQRNAVAFNVALRSDI